METFDDNSNDDYPNEEWIKRRLDEDGRRRKLYAKSLVREDGFYAWKRIEVLEYNEVRDRFTGVTKEGSNLEVHRLFICFEAEDPRKFVRRLSTAVKNRIYADSLIRYNQIID